MNMWNVSFLNWTEPYSVLNKEDEMDENID